MRRILFLLLIVTLLIIPLLAQEPTVGQQLVNAATNPDEPQFQVLLASALESGVLTILDDSDANITVFAPTDEAFFKALDELGMSYSDFTADTSRLIAILTYHVVEGRISAEDLANQSTLNTLYGDTTLNVSVSADGIRLNDNAQILESDITASNGIIHVIDTMLMPPQDSGTNPGTSTQTATLADIVSSRDDLSTMWEALEAAGFTNALAQNDQPLTLFLPNNDALEAAGLSVSDLGINEIAYHAVQGHYLLADLADFDSLPSQQGDEITVTATNSGVILNEEASIIEGDIIASNGVIHIIDHPLTLPGVIPTEESTEEAGD